MIPRRGRGVTSGVMRAIGLDSTAGLNLPLRMIREFARCFCGSELEFPLGEFGQTLERCMNPRCPNHQAHTPGSVAAQLPPAPPPDPPRRRKKRATPEGRRRNKGPRRS